MLLTRECDYGVRVIRALADGSKQTVDTIATKELMPSKFTYKIIKKLEVAGFVQSIRGREGGYRLIKPLSGFSLLDVVLAVDDNRYINECLKEDSNCKFKLNRNCSVHLELERVQGVLVKELTSKSMEEVLCLSASKDDKIA